MSSTSNQMQDGLAQKLCIIVLKDRCVEYGENEVYWFALKFKNTGELQATVLSDEFSSVLNMMGKLVAEAFVSTVVNKCKTQASICRQHEKDDSNSVVCLLGNTLPKRWNTDRVIFGPFDVLGDPHSKRLIKFDSNCKNIVALKTQRSIEGFESSIQWADEIIGPGSNLQLLLSPVKSMDLGPELSIERLCFARDKAEALRDETFGHWWVAIVIDDFLEFREAMIKREIDCSLKSRDWKLLTDQHIRLLQSEFLSGDGSKKKICFYFGNPPHGCRLRCINLDEDNVSEFDSFQPRVNKENAFIPGYFEALHQAYMAVSNESFRETKRQASAKENKRPSPLPLNSATNAVASSKRSSKDEKKPSKKIKIDPPEVTVVQPKLNISKGKKRKSLVDLTNDSPVTKDEASKPNRTSRLTENDFSMPQFDEIRPILEEAGYSFRENLYCRPDCDPENLEGAKEGVNYFTNVLHFRKYLCANEVEKKIGFNWKHKEKERVSIWVQYATSDELSQATRLPDEHYGDEQRMASGKLKQSINWKTLEKLGFTYKNGNRFLPSLPDSVGEPKKFKDETELNLHLRKYGLPRECKNLITDEEWKELELRICLSHSPHFNY